MNRYLASNYFRLKAGATRFLSLIIASKNLREQLISSLSLGKGRKVGPPSIGTLVTDALLSIIRQAAKERIILASM